MPHPPLGETPPPGGKGGSKCRTPLGRDAHLPGGKEIAILHPLVAHRHRGEGQGTRGEWRAVKAIQTALRHPDGRP